MPDFDMQTWFYRNVESVCVKIYVDGEFVAQLASTQETPRESKNTKEVYITTFSKSEK
jgi:hypothetical protein